MLRPYTFSCEKSIEPRTESSANFADDVVKQFAATFTMLGVPTTQQRSAPNEGMYTYASDSGVQEHFVISRDSTGAFLWSGRISGTDYCGRLNNDDGRVYADLVPRTEGTSRRKTLKVSKFEVIKFSNFSDDGVSFHFKNIEHVEEICRHGKKKGVQEQSLKTVCDFFGVELGVDDERRVSLWDPRTWFNWASSADLEQLSRNVKGTVMLEAYSWLSRVFIAKIDKLDEELTSLDTVIRKLYNGLSSPTHLNEDYTLPIYWEFTAKMKNEILRTFCRWATASAEQRRIAKDDQITQKFKTEMEPLQKNFIRAVTEVQTDKNMAGVFLGDFWMCISQKTKQQMVTSAVSTVAQRFVDPSAFLKDCNRCYIQQFGKPEGKAPERVFEYIVKPAEEMKLHAEGCIQNFLEKEQTRAKTMWTTQMKEIRDAFVDLCRVLRVQIKDQSSSCVVADDTVFEESEEVRKKNFITFVESVNASSVPFRIVNDTKHVSTGAGTLGEDDKKLRCQSHKWIQ